MNGALQLHPAVAGVLELVAVTQGLDVGELAIPTRGSPAAAAARQVAMYLCVVDLEMSRKQVARAIGRDRTTVGYAVARVEDRRDDPDFEAAIAALEQRLVGHTVPIMRAQSLAFPMARGLSFQSHGDDS